MTYNVLMGTLNPTHSFIHASLCTVLLTFLLSLLNAFMYLQSAAVPALSPLYYLVSRFFSRCVPWRRIVDIAQHYWPVSSRYLLRYDLPVSVPGVLSRDRRVFNWIHRWSYWIPLWRPYLPAGSYEGQRNYPAAKICGFLGRHFQ